MEPHCRLLILALHPVQYHAELYRQIGRIDGVNSTVVFLDRMGLDRTRDPLFNADIEWDVPLLDGYKFLFLKNIARNRSAGFFQRVNPGIVPALVFSGFDVLWVQGYSTFTMVFALVLARLLRKKILWRGEAVMRQEVAVTWRMRLKEFFLPLFFRSIDAVFYTCSGNKRYLEHYGVGSHKLFPLPCAVDNAFYQHGASEFVPERSRLRVNTGLDETDFVVLLCARLTLWKRPADVIEAVGRLGRPDFSVLVVGDGPERTKLEHLARKLRVKAVFVGFKNQRELLRYYAMADVFVLPSSFDPSPKGLNEILNFGIPAIVTDVIGTADDLVVDGVNGFQVNVGDVEAISARLYLLFQDRDLRRSMGKKSRDLVNHYTFEEDAEGVARAIAFAMQKGVS